jgi:tRNA G18 (ribose-2'-O)-methylase SpoU
MRACGYQCVAAEQTTRSVPLEHFHFPARTVLVLGDEKEGVPVELLRHVDYTVEVNFFFI